MLAKLIAALLQAKAGAISGVFLLGATGALISVSASNGVTTITVTEATPTPTVAVSPVAVVTPTPTPTPTPTTTPSTAPAVAAPATADCSAEAKALALQVQRVNSAFSGFHSKLEALRKDGNKDTIQKADKELKSTRQTAVKAIHATRTCKDDDDKDEAKSETSDKDNDENKDEDKDEDDDKATTAPATPVTVTTPVTTPTTTTTTAEAIATAAIAKMQATFDGVKLTAPAANTHKPEVKQAEGTKRPEAARTARPTEAQHRD